MANLSNINNKFIVTDGGNILIGATADGGSRLQVSNLDGATGYKTARFHSNATGGGTRVIITNTVNTSNGGYGFSTGGNGTDGPGANKFSIGSFNSDNTYINFKMMTFVSSGNVGIGTASPISGFKLDVQGGDFRVGDDANQGFEAGYSAGGGLVFVQGYNRGTNAFVDMSINNSLTVLAGGNVGIGVTSPAGKLEVAGGSTLGLRLSNVGDQSAYDQVRMTYSGYNSGAPTVTFMPLTTPGSGNAYTTFLFQNTNGINASSNNNANVAIDGTLQVGKAKGTGETTLIMNNYDATLVDAGSIQNSIRMSGRYWSGSASQLVETRINSVHQESNGNGGSALTFWTQTGGDAATEQMRIDKVGNVGIGVTPTQKLDVAGIVKHQGLDMTAGVQVDQTTSITKTLTGTANVWRPTGIDNNDIPSTGSYLVQVQNNDHSGAGPANYSWYWTGTMSWYVGATNNNVTSEIYLQGCGHHTNMVLELRTKVNYNSAGIPFAELEWKANTSFVNSPGWIFKFRRLM